MPEVALVTGASGGIGEDLARLIAAGGRDVVLLARTLAERKVQMSKSRVFQMTSVMSSADAVRAGYDAMIAGALNAEH